MAVRQRPVTNGTARVEQRWLPAVGAGDKPCVVVDQRDGPVSSLPTATEQCSHCCAVLQCPGGRLRLCTSKGRRSLSGQRHERNLTCGGRGTRRTSRADIMDYRQRERQASGETRARWQGRSRRAAPLMRSTTGTIQAPSLPSLSVVSGFFTGEGFRSAGIGGTSVPLNCLQDSRI